MTTSRPSSRPLARHDGATSGRSSSSPRTLVHPEQARGRAIPISPGRSRSRRGPRVADGPGPGRWQELARRLSAILRGSLDQRLGRAVRYNGATRYLVNSEGRRRPQAEILLSVTPGPRPRPRRNDAPSLRRDPHHVAGRPPPRGRWPRRCGGWPPSLTALREAPVVEEYIGPVWSGRRRRRSRRGLRPQLSGDGPPLGEYDRYSARLRGGLAESLNPPRPARVPLHDRRPASIVRGADSSGATDRRPGATGPAGRHVDKGSQGLLMSRRPAGDRRDRTATRGPEVPSPRSAREPPVAAEDEEPGSAQGGADLPCAPRARPRLLLKCSRIRRRRTYDSRAPTAPRRREALPRDPGVPRPAEDGRGVVRVSARRVHDPVVQGDRRRRKRPFVYSSLSPGAAGPAGGSAPRWWLFRTVEEWSSGGRRARREAAPPRPAALTAPYLGDQP